MTSRLYARMPGDFVVFFIYLVAVSAYGWYVYKREKPKSADSKDYFLAEGSLIVPKIRSNFGRGVSRPSIAGAVCARNVLSLP